MDSTTLISIVGTIAATIGGKEAWTYYKKRLDIKSRLKNNGIVGEIELRNEIKEMLGDQIFDLKEQVRLLTKRILLLEEEREFDKRRIANQEIKITLLSERLATKSVSIGRKRKIEPLDDIPTVD